MKRRVFHLKNRMVLLASLLAVSVFLPAFAQANAVDKDGAGARFIDIKNVVSEALRVGGLGAPKNDTLDVAEDEAAALILRSRIEGVPYKDGFIEAIDIAGKVYLPLSYMVYVFEYPVSIAKDGLSASGLLSPNRNFLLDLNKRTVQVGDLSSSVTREKVRLYEGHVYISVDSFDAWFGVKTKIDRTLVVANFVTDKKFSSDDADEAPFQVVPPSAMARAAVAAVQKTIKPVVPVAAAPQAPVVAPVEVKPKSNRPNENVATSGGEVLDNLMKLAAVQGKVTLGNVDAYIDRQNIFLRLPQVAKLLGFTYKIHADADTAEIVQKDGTGILLDFKRQEYVVANERRSFFYYDVYKKGDEYFAHTDFLNRMLPKIGFVVDLSSQQVDFSYVDGKPPEQSVASAGDIAPAPQAAPSVPVVVDDSVSPQQPLEPQPEATDVVHAQEQGAINEIHESETLILQPRIKNAPPQNEFLETLEMEGQIFLPLNDLLQLFEFPIKLENNNTASGFFLNASNSFYLNVDAREVKYGDQKRTVTAHDVRRHDGQIYISTEAFAEWFGIQSELIRSSSTLHFMTDKKLPQEEKEEREKRWQNLLSQTEKSDKDLPYLENPYQFLGYPTFDVNLGTQYTHVPAGSVKPFASNYNVQGVGEIGYLTTKVYAQGATQQGALNLLRVEAGRKDPNADLLGPLQATDFAFGDVTSPSLSLVTNNSLGRGVTITNRDINAPENFDFRNFSGDATPGYEVELYRNDALIAFQTVDASGRYNFTNIPILYGTNIFRTVFYGQQGQREEKVETVSASNSLLKAGQFVYTLGVEQRGEAFLPVTKNINSNINTPPGMQAVGGFRYGLARDVTLGAALAETKLEDGEHRYATTTVGANIFDVLTEANLAQDIDHNGWAGSLAALGGFEGVSLRTRYRTFDNFFSEAVNSNDQPLSSDISFDANTQLYLPVIGSYSVGLSALRENFVDTTLRPRDTYSWRSSKTFWGVSLTNSVDYIIDEQKRFQSTFGVQARVFNVDFRAVGITEIKPVRRLQQATVAGDYKITDRLSAQTQIDKNLVSNQTNLLQNFNWDFDDFRLSLTSQASDQGAYSAGLNMIFSVSHDPTTKGWRTQPKGSADGGAISGRIYIDENSNKQFDVGEPLLPDAHAKLNGVTVAAEDGNFYAAPVAPYIFNRLVLNPDSVIDPLLTPESRGYRIMTRPGDAVSTDIALVRTTVVDGSVVYIDDQNTKHDMGDIVVELLDNDGKPIRRVVSEVDGYFSFDKVQAGSYWLSVPQEALDAVHMVLAEKVPIVIKEISEFMTGNEVVLKARGETPVAPIMPLGSSEPVLQSAPTNDDDVPL